jgi:hypothetical protein
MTYLELKDLIRALRFQFHGENDAARKEAERRGWPRPAPRSLYDYVAHQHGWRYALTAHGIGRADLDGHN